MTDLTPMTALGDTAPRVATYGPLTLSENDGLALASLALAGGKVPAPFGIVLPDAGRMTCNDGYGAFWTSPNQWMVMAEGQAHSDFAARVEAVAESAFVTEQTGGWAAFEIVSASGRQSIDDLMAKLVNLDPIQFGEEAATRTGLHHQSVYVLRPDEHRLTILGMRSSSSSLWHVIDSAARRQHSDL